MLYLFLVSILTIILLYKCCNNYNTHKVYGKIAKTNKEIKKGLMYRKIPLNYNEGMLFLMKYKNNSMWMKNTYIPLDVIFLDHNMRIIGYVIDTIPLSLNSISINKKSNNVLEMNSGSINNFDMKIGDKILFFEKNT